MDYLEWMKLQENIISYAEQLRGKISFVDPEGRRKLDPYYFLSGEVAAYKLLSSWINSMRRGNDVVNERVGDLVDLIRKLVEEDYEDYQIYEAEISMPLWYELMKSFKGDALSNFNSEILVLASIAEVRSGILPENTLICTMTDDELTDANLVSYAYSLVHDYLIGLSREDLELFAQKGFGLNADKGELYKLHFNLFQ